MDALRKAAEQALEALEVPLHTPTARKQAWDAINALRAELAEQEQATGKDSFTVDWMKQALTVVWNFPSHPGFHPADSSADQDGEDPTSAWRAGWIAAVGAMQDAVRNVTPDPQGQEQEQQPVADDALLLADGNAEMADMLRIQHAIILELRAEVERLAQDYVRACKLVAGMHAAATGRPGEGPRLGVVEDVAAVREEVERLREALQRIADFTLLEFEGPHHMALACVETARTALAQKETT